MTTTRRIYQSTRSNNNENTDNTTIYYLILYDFVVVPKKKWRLPTVSKTQTINIKWLAFHTQSSSTRGHNEHIGTTLVVVAGQHVCLEPQPRPLVQSGVGFPGRAECALSGMERGSGGQWPAFHEGAVCAHSTSLTGIGHTAISEKKGHSSRSWSFGGSPTTGGSV